MNATELGGVVRTLLAAVGGYLAGKGYFDGATAEALAGALTTLVVAGWSIFAKRKTA